MKTKFSLLVLLTFGFSVAAKAEASIPAPIFYKLSKRLLSETQCFFDKGEAKAIKPRMENVPLNPLKCQTKKEQKITNFGILNINNRESLWKTKPDN